MRFTVILLGIQLFFFANHANAVMITSATMQVAGEDGRYTTEFTINNNLDSSGPSLPVEAFEIFFEVDRYFDLAVIAAPSDDWFFFELQPIMSQTPTFLDNGSFIAEIDDSSNAIATGESLSGFVVGYSVFDNLPVGPWAFEIFDPFNFDPALTVAGTTTSSTVSEPSVILLFAGGLLTMGFSRRRSLKLKAASRRYEMIASLRDRTGALA